MLLGVICDEFERYTQRRLGPEGLLQLRLVAASPESGFERESWYPDELFEAMVSGLVVLTGRSSADILEDFAEQMVPALLQVYAFLIDSEWGFLDLLLNTERVVHKGVRLYSQLARPPAIRAERLDAETVAVIYASPRHLCMVAKGIIRGSARAYKTPIQMTEEQCMLEGASQCYIRVRCIAPRSTVTATFDGLSPTNL